MRVLGACSLFFVVLCAHSDNSEALHLRRHLHRRVVGPDVHRTRWRRHHVKHNYVIGHRSRHHGKLAKHLRRFDDDDVMERATDKMAAEAINELFGPRQFAAPVRPKPLHHRPIKHDKSVAPSSRDKARHRDRHHKKKTGDRVSSEKTFMLELPVGCEAEPCQHDGDCYTDPSSSLGYACRCQPGYTGDFCEIGKHSECRSVNVKTFHCNCVIVFRNSLIVTQTFNTFGTESVKHDKGMTFRLSC